MVQAERWQDSSRGGPRFGIVLWNTRYQDAALDHLRRDGHDVRDDDVRRLSPLGHDHINLLGRYQFSATDLPDGSLRPLRDPAAPQT